MAQERAHSSALIGRLDSYDEVEDIRNYIERLNLYFQANDIAEGKQVAVLLSAVGANVYKTAKSLSEPTPVTEKTYTELCELLISHYGPKRLVWVREISLLQAGPKASRDYCSIRHDSAKLGQYMQVWSVLG